MRTEVAQLLGLEAAVFAESVRFSGSLAESSRGACEGFVSITPEWAVSPGCRGPLRLVLEAVAGLDAAGGASLGLVAWDLCVEEHEVADAWQRAIADGLLKRSGHDDTHGEQLWRLTAGGWAALDDQPEQPDQPSRTSDSS